MGRKKLIASLAASALTLSAAPAFAAEVLITFDEVQANYVPTPGTKQEITNQFAPLGVLFSDVSTPGRGAIAGKCGPGEGAVALFGFGNNGGCGDYTPNLDILFVNPLDSLSSGYTTAFSILNFDGLIQATAFDSQGNLLGTTSNYSGLLSFSGIGNISRVNLLSIDQDPTTLDTLRFEQVLGISGAVPEPTTWMLMMLGMAGIGFSMRRKDKQTLRVSFS